MTISEAMVLQRTLRSRISDLSSIRNANMVRSRKFYMGDDREDRERTETELQYDPQVVDTKITELELFLFKLDAAIKRANAKTEIGIEADVDKLLEPIKAKA
jgi:hypothetical protein